MLVIGDHLGKNHSAVMNINVIVSRFSVVLGIYSCF